MLFGICNPGLLSGRIWNPTKPLEQDALLLVADYKSAPPSSRVAD
jgi:hypothetical protein